MSANPTPRGGFTDPFPGEEEARGHAPEPWRQDGRYIRDSAGAIVVRGRSAADARRIAAAVNGTCGIPTEALEGWSAHDVSDPGTRPDLEIDLAEEPRSSPFAVHPPNGFSLEPTAAPGGDSEPRSSDRRLLERRRRQRRQSSDPVEMAGLS